MVHFGRVVERSKPRLTSRWTYAGAAVVTLAAATSMALGAAGASCSESPAQLASRLGELQKTYADVYRQGSADIQACPSLDCERPPKLEIAAALGSYNQGLSSICWPTRDQSWVSGLTAANSAEASAYNSWAEAATPADDQVMARPAVRSAGSQQAAWRALAIRLAP